MVAARRIPIAGVSIKMHRSHQSDPDPAKAAVPRAGVQGKLSSGKFHFLLISVDSHRMTFIPLLSYVVVVVQFFPTFNGFHKRLKGKPASAFLF